MTTTKTRESENPFTEEELPAEPVCYTCPYYGESDSGEDTCRRWAPQPRVCFSHEDDVAGESSDESLTHIPKMSGIDVCGEHPLMPQYIESLKAAGVLKLGTATLFSGSDTRRYADWRNRKMKEFLGAFEAPKEKS